MKMNSILENSWLMNRGGFLNYWCYDDEVFDFKGGNLLLRGENGSGKSITSTAFAPILLDGKKSAERLDPFGSRSRKMEYYLLGDAHSLKEDETGYIYLEFKRKYSNEYKTIGIGMRARRDSARMESWYFIIKDGKRIGLDFFLYEERSKGEKIPLSGQMLERRLGESGEFFTNQDDYMEAVNRELFGFENIYDYRQLINLIVQTRRPKLNNDFEPKVIGEILTDCLDPLSTEDLRIVAESLQDMDNVEESITRLQNALKISRDFKKHYDIYNSFILSLKAKKLIYASNNLSDVQSKIKRIQIDLCNAKNDLMFQESEINNMENELQVAKITQLEYQGTEVWKASEKVETSRKKLNSTEEDLINKKANIDYKEEQRREIENQLKYIRIESVVCDKEYRETLDTMEILAETGNFDMHSFGLANTKIESIEQNRLQVTKMDISRHLKELRIAKGIIEKTQLIQSKHDDEVQKLERLKDEYEELQKQSKKQKGLLQEMTQEFINMVCLWRDGNKIFKFRQDNFFQLLNSINRYASGEEFSLINKVLISEGNYINNEINQRKFKLEFEKENIVENLKLKKQELEELRKVKDPEPLKTNEVIKNRQRLKDLGIPFIPFYLAVDFVDDIEEDERNILESALFDMGLLDALIIPKEYREKAFEIDKDMSDKYISVEPNFMVYELSQKLKVAKHEVSGIDNKDIDNAIRSVLLSMDKKSTYIQNNGRYGIGIIEGKAAENYRSRFIGLSSRKRYKEMLGKELVDSIETLNKQMYELQEKIIFIEEELLCLEKEKRNFPSEEDVQTAKDMINQLDNRIEGKENDLKLQQDLVIHIFKELNEQKVRQGDVVRRFSIKINPLSYEEAIGAMEEYQDSFNVLLRLFNKHEGDVRLVKIHEERIEDVDNDLDILRSDRIRIENEIKVLKAQIEEFQRILDNSDYKIVKDILMQCAKKIEELPKLMMDAGNIMGQLKNAVENYDVQLSTLKESLDIYQLIEETSLNIFKEEYNLLHVKDVFLDYDCFPTNVIKIAHEIVKEYPFSDLQKDRIHYEKILIDEFHNIMYPLTEYSMRMVTIFVTDIYEEDNEEVKQLKREQKRIQVEGKIEMQYVSFYKLLENIELQLEEQKNILTEENTTLLKTILAKDISGKINAKIYRSKLWVKEIDKLLSNRDFTNGLTFNLIWEPKKGAGFQLDTKDLEIFFKSDHEFLTENNLERLSNHFKSKIEEARLEMRAVDAKKSYSDIIREILDFRYWFEFKLYSHKEGEQKKELTKNVYGAFSGGERALSAYAPLIAAIHAVYLKARKDCPRVITLDEAFAGVSDTNINDMFELLNKLDLTYIFNSEKLWGTYETIKELSIAELIKEKNEDVVGVMRYYWNGRRLEEIMLYSDEEYELNETEVLKEVELSEC